MANGTFTFRPRSDYEGDFQFIEEWCAAYGVPINAVINSYLPAISYALANKVFIENGKIIVQSDFGPVQIIKGKENQTAHEFYS